MSRDAELLAMIETALGEREAPDETTQHAADDLRRLVGVDDLQDAARMIRARLRAS